MVFFEIIIDSDGGDYGDDFGMDDDDWKDFISPDETYGDKLASLEVASVSVSFRLQFDFYFFYFVVFNSFRDENSIDCRNSNQRMKNSDLLFILIKIFYKLLFSRT